MDNKSVEILNELRQYLSKEKLSIDVFPKQEVIQIVCAEYTQWLKKQASDLNEYAAIYALLIDNAKEKSDRSKLLGLLDELIYDLQRIPAEMPEKMNRLRSERDSIVVEHFKKNARKAYERYMFPSRIDEAPFRGRGVVYTVITGGYDVLQEPAYIDPKFDYICFTDNKEISSQSWEIRYIENRDGLDNVRLARKHKILCHEFLKEYDYSVYIDGKIKIIGNFNEYIEKYSKGSSMLCFPHFVRECAYEEAEACVKAGKDREEIINKQMDGYRLEGYPVHYGLIDSACLVRCHNDAALQKVLECWWNEVRNKSRRDQMSIGYACWKNNFHYDLCDLFIYSNEYICKRREREPSW